jgi:hypothetical protein
VDNISDVSVSLHARILTVGFFMLLVPFPRFILTP